jgi:hypothetical protein
VSSRRSSIVRQQAAAMKARSGPDVIAETFPVAVVTIAAGR